MSAITGPIALYNNVPIEPRFYIPRRYVITGIVLGRNTVINTLEDNLYTVGQQIRLVIPSYNGCTQLNGVQGLVLEILSPTSILTNIYSAENVDPFVIST